MRNKIAILSCLVVLTLSLQLGSKKFSSFTHELTNSSGARIYESIRIASEMIPGKAMKPEVLFPPPAAAFRDIDDILRFHRFNNITNKGLLTHGGKEIFFVASNPDPFAGRHPTDIHLYCRLDVKKGWRFFLFRRASDLKFIIQDGVLIGKSDNGDIGIYQPIADIDN